MGCLLMVACFHGNAENLGIVGKAYPIAEPDMIEWIKMRALTMMKDGRWQRIESRAIANARNQINNPKAVIGITDATVTKTWYYKPMIQVKQDITDHQGHLIAKAGLYNALRYKPFDVELMFINGNNSKQVTWAINHMKKDSIRTKIILTQGSFIKLDKQFKVWFYYDQNGRYTKKLKIQHVTAMVTQDGEQLKIMEVANGSL